MRIRRIVVLLGILFVSQIWLSGCGLQKDVSKEREVLANKADNNIIIAVVGPMAKEDTFGYLDGIMLAAEEINKNGGIDNKQIEILKFDDKGLTVEGINIAHELAGNPKIMAVIGHWDSHVTLAAASIYENSEMLMITSMITTPKLTQSGYNYIFRNIPSDERMGEEMAKFAKSRGHKRMAIYYADTEYGKELANSFEDSAESIGVKIVDRTTQSVDDHMFDRTMKRWKALNFDGVFVADHMPSAVEFILEFKEAHPEIPIVGTNGLDDPDFIDILGAAAEGAVMATLYNPGDQNPKLKQFVEEFKGYYDRDPNAHAVQGYETLKLLAGALELADNPTPSETAEALRSMKQWPSLTGVLNVEENGDVTGKVIHMKIVKNGEFGYLPAKE